MSSRKSTIVSRIICWKCGRGGQRGDAPLKKISETNYVCLNDIQWGAPEKEHMSEIFFENKKPDLEAVTQEAGGGGIKINAD